MTFLTFVSDFASMKVICFDVSRKGRMTGSGLRKKFSKNRLSFSVKMDTFRLRLNASNTVEPPER
jgi:hypothetical protein